MKPEHFPFARGDAVVITVFEGPSVEGRMLGASEGGLTVQANSSALRFVPWPNLAGATARDLTHERVEEIGAIVAVPAPIRPALADQQEI